MFEVMLIGLLVLVLILIPLCIGFVAIVRWIMRRTRRVSGQPPGYCGGAVASSGGYGERVAGQNP